MDYADARGQISTGDLIAVRTVDGVLNKVTKFFTGRYVHCGQAIWIAGRLYMTELNEGRNHLVPMSQLDGMEFDVYAHPDGLTTEAMETAILDNLGRKVNYGYTALLAIGLVEWLKLNLVVKWSKILVCSGYSIKNWQDAGWKGAASRIISPTKLAGMMQFKFAVTVPPPAKIIPACSVPQ